LNCSLPYLRFIKKDALKCWIYHDKNKGVEAKVLAAHDIVITTSDIMVADWNKQKKLQKVAWFRIILDEGKENPIE